ncbi:methyltransferase domain-containing protein [Actinoplanes sp. LDG1-06]|uniref:Methyltransferase domain-containing protein n=1 Tax=Paractinoplanes ovalisporus TaxID=2810368 RepID=A0ABS2A3B4_9ACTN|nr:class I SAM-dependent methyltransferase [Actinoplanes ovalisporus]MBM2614319.1 methyltransferase domain-containing protein [Actinoplanes ovalisporus]
MSSDVVALFDRLASSYDSVLPFFASFGRLTADRLPAPAPGDRLLDVGAGRGAVAFAARSRGYTVTATDAAPAMVALLRPELDAHVMYAASLDFPDGTFDVVTAGLVVHLLDDPAAMVSEVRRVLKPGGLFAFTVPGRVPEGFEFADGANELFAAFSVHLPPGGGMGAPFDELEALAGFTDVTETDLRVELPVGDAGTLWEWFQTHGSRKFFDDLPPVRRDEFRRRLLDDLNRRDRIVLRRYAWLYTGRSSPLTNVMPTGVDRN